MIANVQQIANTVFYSAQKTVTKPSTYQQRVKADRIVMLVLLCFAVLLGIITA